MRLNLPRPAAGDQPIYLPPKYRDVIEMLIDHGPCSAAEIGAALSGSGQSSGRMTSLAHGRLRALLDVGAVERVDTVLHGDHQEPARPIRWHATDASRAAIRGNDTTRAAA